MIEINNNDSTEYKVRDIYEAAYLYASGCKVSHLEKTENYFNFVFPNSDDCLVLRDLFHQGLGEIQPKHYADAIKFLKQRVFQEMKEGSYVH